MVGLSNHIRPTPSTQSEVPHLHHAGAQFGSHKGQLGRLRARAPQGSQVQTSWLLVAEQSKETRLIWFSGDKIRLRASAPWLCVIGTNMRSGCVLGHVPSAHDNS